MGKTTLAKSLAHDEDIRSSVSGSSSRASHIVSSFMNQAGRGVIQAPSV
jgi:hypothetical protein